MDLALGDVREGACLPLPSGTLASGRAWWTWPDGLGRYLRHLVRAELQGLRPQLRGLALSATAADTSDGLAEAGVDSLELMSLSTALAEALDLRDAESLSALYRDPTLAGWQMAVRQGLSRQAGAGEWVRFRSSGSTGQPSVQTHGLAALWQEAAHLARCVGPVRRVIAAVPAHHIYGFLTTVLLPQCPPGAGVVPTLDATGQPPAWLLAQLQADDLVVSHPAHWQALCRLQPLWPAGVTGLCSTAPCPDALSDALLAGGLGRLIHLYGSSETAGVGWREWPQKHYQLHPFWHRSLAAYSEPHASGEPLDHPHDHPGDLLWRDAADAGAPARQHRLPDRLLWHGERHFELCGRRDAVVQVAGVNVNLVAVARVLERHPLVSEAAVRLAPVAAGRGAAQAHWASARLKAFVVPQDMSCLAAATQRQALQNELLSWCRRHLSPAERPVSVVCGAALPRGPGGKLCDWTLPLQEPVP